MISSRFSKWIEYFVTPIFSLFCSIVSINCVTTSISAGILTLSSLRIESGTISKISIDNIQTSKEEEEIEEIDYYSMLPHEPIIFEDPEKSKRKNLRRRQKKNFDDQK